MLCPMKEGYSFTPGNNLREQEVKGTTETGPLFIGAYHRVKVTVLLDKAGKGNTFGLSGGLNSVNLKTGFGNYH